MKTLPLSILTVLLFSTPVCFAQPFEGNGKPEIASNIALAEIAFIMTAFKEACSTSQVEQPELHLDGEENVQDAETDVRESGDEDLCESIVERANSEMASERLEAIGLACYGFLYGELNQNQIKTLLWMLMKLTNDTVSSIREYTAVAIGIALKLNLPSDLPPAGTSLNLPSDLENLWYDLLKLCENEDTRKTAMSVLVSLLTAQPLPEFFRECVYDYILRRALEASAKDKDGGTQAAVARSIGGIFTHNTFSLSFQSEILMTLLTLNESGVEYVQEAAAKAITVAVSKQESPKDIDQLILRALTGFLLERRLSIFINPSQAINSAIDSHETLTEEEKINLKKELGACIEKVIEYKKSSLKRETEAQTAGETKEEEPEENVYDEA